MTREDILTQLEDKVADAISHIDALLKRIQTLQTENVALRSEQQVWREELQTLLTRFDHINMKSRQPLMEPEFDLVGF